MTLEEWKAAAVEYAKEHYGYGDFVREFEDLAKGCFDNDETPQEFVEYYAGKYGLVRVEDFNLSMAKHVIGSFGGVKIVVKGSDNEKV